MKVFTDQTGRNISLVNSPRRIISIVPSQTELLSDLGLDEEVVGITRFCVHPRDWFYAKTRVGGTRKLHINAIHELQPDLIIANKEENVKEQVEELALNYPVWVSDVNNLADAYEMIGQVGLITNRAMEASGITGKINSAFSELGTISNKPGVAYLIWKDPYMTVGGDTFIHAMLDAAGFTNVFSDKTRYPEITMEDIRSREPAILLLSSEPFPFRQKHLEELALAFDKMGLKNIRIEPADGEMFSWYGSRLQQAPAYFKELRYRLSN